MKNKVKCSIVVANYNNGRFLEQLIESVLNQTHANWELIITDDASTDNSISIINRFLYDKRIKLIELTKNQGAANAFKTSIENSSGNIIAMLGADDALKKNAIELIVQQHNRYPNAAMIIANLICCDENLQPTGKYIKFFEIDETDSYINYFGISGWDTFKRTFYDKTEGIDIDLKRAVDQDLYLKMEEFGELKHFDENLYLYRTNPKGISQQNNQSFAHEYNYLAIIKAYKRRKKTGFKNLSKKKYKNVLVNYEYLRIINDYKKGKFYKADIEIKETFKSLLENKKLNNIQEFIIFFSFLDTISNSYNIFFIKKKLLTSFFIKKKYNSYTLKALFYPKIKAYKYLSYYETIKITVKSILNWQAK